MGMDAEITHGHQSVQRALRRVRQFRCAAWPIPTPRIEIATGGVLDHRRLRVPCLRDGNHAYSPPAGSYRIPSSDDRHVISIGARRLPSHVVYRCDQCTKNEKKHTTNVSPNGLGCICGSQLIGYRLPLSAPPFVSVSMVGVSATYNTQEWFDLWETMVFTTHFSRTSSSV